MYNIGFLLSFVAPVQLLAFLLKIPTTGTLVIVSTRTYPLDTLKQKSGQNSNLNVQYNPKTDTVQIFYNGEWVDWKTGGLQTHWLYKDGESVVQFTSPINYHTSYYTAKEASFESSYVDLTSANTSNSCCAIGTDSLDLSNYTKIKVQAIINGTERTDELDISNISAGCVVVGKRIYTDSSSYFTYELAVCNNFSTGYGQTGNVIKLTEVIMEAGGVNKTVYIKRIWLE